MMQAISNIGTGLYDYKTIGFSRNTQSLTEDKVENSIGVSFSKVKYTFGLRYISGIDPASYTTFRELGDADILNPSYNHNHPFTVDDDYIGGYADAVGGAYVYEYDAVNDASYVPKYYILGNVDLKMSDRNSYPKGTLFILSNKKLFSLKNVSSIVNQFIFINKNVDKLENNQHRHVVYTSSYGKTESYFGNCIYGAGHNNYTGYTSTQIDERAELFIYETTDTYYEDKDKTPVGDYLLQRTTETIPSNYSEVSLTKSGLLRFANNNSQIDTENGTETHNHSLSEDKMHDTTDCTAYNYDGIDAADHMPDYVGTRIIERVS